jgi:cytochrome b subunit of formate dehydrogenase
VKRFLKAFGAALFGIFVITVSSVFAQGGTPQGFPPQTDLFNDALLLARALPLIVALGIGFGIWQGKTSVRAPKSSPNSPVVTRHDFGTVIAHWANGIGFMIGILTGAIVLRWLPRPDDMRIVFAIHYVGSSLVVFSVASHLAQNAVTGGMGLIPRSLRDVREGLGELVEYTGVFGPGSAVFGISWPKALRKPIAEIFVSFGIAPPKRLGKFLPAEKVFSYTPWLIIIAVMTVTGLIKAFRYLYPIPPSFIAQVSAVHDLFTIVAVVMLGIHLAALLLVPRNWGLVVSMFTTRVSRKRVEQWHPAWMKQLQEAEQKQQPVATKEAGATTQAEQAKA